MHKGQKTQKQKPKKLEMNIPLTKSIVLQEQECEENIIKNKDLSNRLTLNHLLFVKKVTDTCRDLIGFGLSPYIDCTKKMPEFITHKCAQTKTIKHNFHSHLKLNELRCFLHSLYGS